MVNTATRCNPRAAFVHCTPLLIEKSQVTSFSYIESINKAKLYPQKYWIKLTIIWCIQGCWPAFKWISISQNKSLSNWETPKCTKIRISLSLSSIQINILVDNRWLLAKHTPWTPCFWANMNTPNRLKAPAANIYACQLFPGHGPPWGCKSCSHDSQLPRYSPGKYCGNFLGVK